MTYDTLFLDRDGVLNRKIEQGYVLKIADLEILPGIKDFLSWAHSNFQQIVVVTNQRCIGRQMLKEEDLLIIHQELNVRTGNVINAFFFCPHLEEEQCACRKPREGLFLKAAEKYAVDFSRSWMIGDSISDLIPAKKLGLHTIYLGHTPQDYADYTRSSARELLSVFIR